MKVLSAVAAGGGYTYRADQNYVIVTRNGEENRADILLSKSARRHHSSSGALLLILRQIELSRITILCPAWNTTIKIPANVVADLAIAV